MIDRLGLSISDWITLGSACFALMSGIIAFLYGRALRRSERLLRNFETQISRVDRELIVWGGRCIDAMSHAHILLATGGSGRQPNDIRILRDEIQSSLSAFVDMGRLYFPNRSPDLEGLDRPPAYRGFRPAILDAVMLVHEELKYANAFDGEETQKAAHNIFMARRIFISEFQEEIDRLRDKKLLDEIRTMDDDWREMSTLVKDYEDRKGKTFWHRRPRTRGELLKEWKARTQVA